MSKVNFFKPEDFRFKQFTTLEEQAAAIANAKLESAPVVWFNDDKTMSPFWECSSSQDKSHTHTARLVCIEPIVQDTAESLLREFMEYETGDADWFKRWTDLCERARALLAKEEK